MAVRSENIERQVVTTEIVPTTTVTMTADERLLLIDILGKYLDRKLPSDPVGEVNFAARLRREVNAATFPA